METSTEDQLEEHGKDIAVVDMTPPTGEPREDLVNTATAFLMNPRVQQSSIERKRAFLVKKGLTPVEIEMAVARSLRPQRFPLEPAPAPRSWLDMLGSAVMGVAVVSSAAYGLYWVFKTYVEPRLSSGPSSLERSITELVDAVQKMNTERQEAEIRADEKNARFNQLLAELRQDVVSLKGVLVARSQFPPPPATPTIPSWQRTHTSVNGTAININKSQPTSSGPTTTAAPSSQQSVNGAVNGKVTEEAKAIVLTPKQPATSIPEGEHKENIIENGQQQSPHSGCSPPDDEPVKSNNSHKKGHKNRKIELEG